MALMAAKYSAEEERSGLTALALWNGNAAKASQELKKNGGPPIPQRTLQDWKNSKSEQLAEISQKIVPKIHARVAQRHTELAEMTMKAEEKLAVRMVEEAEGVETRDLPKAQKDLAITGGIHTQRAAELRGQGQVVTHVHRRDPSEIIRAIVANGAGHLINPSVLKSVGDQKAIEGQAEEV